MVKRAATLVLGVFALIALAGGTAQAQSKCQGAKIKAGGKKVSCLLSLESKEASKGVAADPLKVAKCKNKFSAAFAKAETKDDCSTPGDSTAIEAKVDAFVDDADAEIAGGGDPPPTTSKCKSSKLKATGKKAKCLLGLESKRAAKVVTPDPIKVQKCLDKFSKAFAKAELGSDCGASAGDATAIEAKVDAFVDDVACELDAGPACTCGSPEPTLFGFTTGVGVGSCGDVVDSTNASVLSLTCNTLYTGGAGGATPPSVVPDYGTTLSKVCCRGKTLSLRATTSADTGSNRNCSSAGCLYGAPLPITSAASVCVVNVVAQDAVGNGACDTGEIFSNIPLSSNIELTIDTMAGRCSGTTLPVDEGRKCNPANGNADCAGGTCVVDSTDKQPCAICNPTTLVCNGGSNDVPGNAAVPCVPGTLAVTGPQFPTSHDCPAGGAPVGAIPIAYALTTGTSTKASLDNGSQTNVFCGYCASPLGTTFKNSPVACATDADCASFTTGCSGACTACKQRTGGAFGEGSARTITENGDPAGPIATNDPAADATLVSVFCIPPTFNGTIDTVGDLPGPGAASLQGTVELQ